MEVTTAKKCPKCNVFLNAHTTTIATIVYTCPRCRHREETTISGLEIKNNK